MLIVSQIERAYLLTHVEPLFVNVYVVKKALKSVRVLTIERKCRSQAIHSVLLR